MYLPDIFQRTKLGIWAWYHLLMSNMPMKTSRLSGAPHDQMNTTSVASILSYTEVEGERGEEEEEKGEEDRNEVGKEREGRGWEKRGRRERGEEGIERRRIEERSREEEGETGEWRKNKKKCYIEVETRRSREKVKGGLQKTENPGLFYIVTHHPRPGPAHYSVAPQ